MANADKPKSEPVEPKETKEAKPAEGSKAGAKREEGSSDSGRSG